MQITTVIRYCRLLHSVSAHSCALTRITPRQSKAIDMCCLFCFVFSLQTPFMSALFLQYPSFFRHRWCQGSRMAASLWWETVAHVLGWLPSFGIIGERNGGRRREEWGRCAERGPFKPCEIVVSVVGMIFIPFPPFLNTLFQFLPLSSSFCPSPPPPHQLSVSVFSCCRSDDHPEVSRQRSDATGAWRLSDCWISHSLCTSLATLPNHNFNPSSTHKHTHTQATQTRHTMVKQRRFAVVLSEA